jgi:hypothetical protein
MPSVLKAGKILIVSGVAFVALGLVCMLLEAAGMGEYFADIWFILSAAGAFCIVLGAIAFCASAPPKQIVTFSGRTVAGVVLAFIVLAILAPNASVHGPIMPVVIALVGLGALAMAALVVGLVRRGGIQ